VNEVTNKNQIILPLDITKNSEIYDLLLDFQKEASKDLFDIKKFINYQDSDKALIMKLSEDILKRIENFGLRLAKDNLDNQTAILVKHFLTFTPDEKSEIIKHIIEITKRKFDA
jgi:hypothetical protein